MGRPFNDPGVKCSMFLLFLRNNKGEELSISSLYDDSRCDLVLHLVDNVGTISQPYLTSDFTLKA